MAVYSENHKEHTNTQARSYFNEGLTLQQLKEVHLFKRSFIFFFFFWCCGPTRATASPFLRFLDHTLNDAPQSVGLLWTSDQFVTETST